MDVSPAPSANNHSPVSRLSRLLHPRSIAFIGGSEAAIALQRTRELGFPGKIYAVNPKRTHLAGIPCLPSVDDLPPAIDAAFIGVPRAPAIDIVRSLAQRDCGGAIVYASGFGETGPDGDNLQSCLLNAAGGMPFMGPNCYGYVNVLDACALWPDVHALKARANGVAIVTQSGNMACNFTFTQRGLPVAAVYALGNQADIDVSAMVEALLDDDRVTAIGLHIEGLPDVSRLAAAASRALVVRKPIVVLKTGSSDAGARVALSHTGSLAGLDHLYDALFNRYGMIRARSISSFVETLKFLSIVGPLPGSRVVSLSCSGGEAALVADMAEGRKLDFPPFGAAAPPLRATLNELVAIENPLDYHTFIWGKADQLKATFTAALSGPFDLGMLILDMPTGGLEYSDWITAADAMAIASSMTGTHVAIVSTLHECLPLDVIHMLAARGVAPMLGLDDALTAFEAAAWLGKLWQAPEPPAPLPHPTPPTKEPLSNLSERAGKELLRHWAIPIPDGALGTAATAADIADRLGYPIVVKASRTDLLHKSEMNGVALNLADRAAVEAAAIRLAALSPQLLIERMVTGAVAEFIVGVIEDPQFGQAMVIGAGGVLAELLRDTITLLLPTNRAEVEAALPSLQVTRLIDGFRARSGDRPALVEAILNIGELAKAHVGRLAELEVNPLLVLPPGQGVVAVDALIRLRQPGE